MWINTVTVTKTWGVARGWWFWKRKGREKKGSREVGTMGGGGRRENSPYISPVINLVRGV